jgi:hypothetical protein
MHLGAVISDLDATVTVRPTAGVAIRPHHVALQI